MNFRTRYILSPILLGTLAFSCDNKEQEEVSPLTETESTGQATTANLLFNHTFEESDVFSDIRQQFGTSHAFKVVSNPVFAGSKSGRFELRDSDPLTSNGTRAEVLYPENSVGRERWYSFRAYYPAATYKKDSNYDILTQWHQGSGTGSPATDFKVRNDRFEINTRNSSGTKYKVYDLGLQTKDVWHEFVFHIIHSNGSDGLIEVWHNGKKVLTHQGGNMYVADLPRWKMGIYKDDWNGSETTDTNLRAFYLDNLMMGNERATLQDMMSGTTPTAPAPTPTAPAPTEPAPTTGSSSVTGFTLIDSHTEKGVLSITNGSTISLSSLANTKLNIQANTSTSVGSVKMELSGEQSKTYIDSAAPYALHGDNGTGNFYYGNWNPPAVGTYTLKATPYSGSNGSGTAGEAVIYNFTIVE